MRDNFLASCESEALHLSGYIQPHGGLLVSDLDGVVTHVSDNIQRFLPSSEGLKPGSTLPSVLLEIFDTVHHDIGQHLYLELDGGQDNRRVELTVCFSQSACTFELSELVELEEYVAPPKLPTQFSNDADLNAFRQSMLKWISELTQHDRTMYYQFMEQGDGVVVGEVCTDAAEGTYLDLRYPASDIPNIARTLYVKNPWRVIPDSQAEPCAVMAKTGAPDLSYVDLRSVSPVHQVYMKNMGVGASISIPVIRNGALDALISCHSASPRFVSRAALQKISTVIGHYSSLLKEFDIRQRMQFIDEFNFKNERLRKFLNTEELDSVWTLLADELSHNFESEGVILCTPEGTYIQGNGFNESLIEAVDKWFCNDHDELVFHSDHISTEIPELPLTEIAGMCGLRFRSQAFGGEYVRLYLTRGEYIYEVKWGGNPNKPTESHDGQYGISPRQSFSKWVERRLGYSKPWPAMIRLELHRLRSLLEASMVFKEKA